MGRSGILNMVKILQFFCYMFVVNSSLKIKDVIRNEVHRVLLNSGVNPVIDGFEGVNASEIEKVIKNKESAQKLKSFKTIFNAFNAHGSGIRIEYLGSIDEEKFKKIEEASLDSIEFCVKNLMGNVVLGFSIGEFHAEKIQEKKLMSSLGFSKSRRILTHFFVVFTMGLSTSTDNRRTLREIQYDFERMFSRYSTQALAKETELADKAADIMATVAAVSATQNSPIKWSARNDIIFEPIEVMDEKSIREKLIEKLNTLNENGKLFKSTDGVQNLEFMSFGAIPLIRYDFEKPSFQVESFIIAGVGTYLTPKGVTNPVHTARVLSKELSKELELKELRNDGLSNILANSIAELTILRMMKPCDVRDLLAIGTRIYILDISENTSDIEIDITSAQIEYWTQSMIQMLTTLQKSGNMTGNYFKGFGLAVKNYPKHKNRLQAVFVAIFTEKVGDIEWTPTPENSNAEAIIVACFWGTGVRSSNPIQKVAGEIERVTLPFPQGEKDCNLILSTLSNDYGLSQRYAPLENGGVPEHLVFIIICKKVIPYSGQDSSADTNSSLEPDKSIKGVIPR